MSQPILTIEFIPETIDFISGKNGMRINVSAHKILRKSDILDLVEEFSNKLREEVKNEAN